MRAAARTDKARKAKAARTRRTPVQTGPEGKGIQMMWRITLTVKKPARHPGAK